MFEIDPPRDREQLASALERLHGEIDEALGGLSTEVFLAPQGEHWSPAGHLRHLNKSVRPVARALALPKVALVPLAGLSRRPSRSYEEVRATYHEALAAGGQAGSYGPGPRGEEVDDEAYRRQTFDHWRQNGAALQKALAGWKDAALDRYRLPHPLLGKMTAREMLYFTLYHNAHHARRVFERLEGA